MAENSRVALEEFQKPPVEGPGRTRLLSDLEVKDILQDPRIYREIAEDYGISRSLVAKIKIRTASYFQTRSKYVEGKHGKVIWEPNMDLVTQPSHVTIGKPTLLDEEDVQNILQDRRTMREIAEAKGISLSTVWRVKNREYQGRSKDFVHPNERVGTVAGKPLYADDLKRKRA